MADYYVKMEDGSVMEVAGVTATPTLVPESVLDAYYRDQGNAVLPVGDMGYEATVSTDAATGVVLGSSGGEDVSVLYSDDIQHIAPRQLEYELSYWMFPVGTFAYFFRWDRVSGFGNTAPSAFA